MVIRKHHYKQNGGDGIPGELFQILKDDAIKVLCSICQQIWKTQQWPLDWKGQFSFQSQVSAKECSNYWTIVFISHANEIMLKNFQPRLQNYVSQELPDVQDEFRKEKNWDQISNICWIIEKARVPEKHLLLLYWLCQAFDCMAHNKLWKILQEMRISDHVTSLLRNLYEGQESTIRIGHGATE